VVLVAGPVGCFRQGGTPEPPAVAEAPAPTAAATGTPGGSATTAEAVAPAATGPAPAPPSLCRGPKPRESHPFPYNRDSARRDRLLHFVSQFDGATYSGGMASVDDLDATMLATLIEAKFIDPYERQNASPTVWEIFRFLCRHPQVSAGGYAISPDRPDYRMSIDSIYGGEVNAEMRAEAETFCREAEGVEMDSRFECFWD